MGIGRPGGDRGSLSRGRAVNGVHVRVLGDFEAIPVQGIDLYRHPKTNAEEISRIWCSIREDV